MAGFEKVCDLSGEFASHKMYRYKRNHIQIMPQYRSRFKGHKAVLNFSETEYLLQMGPNRDNYYGYSNKEAFKEYKSLLKQGRSAKEAAKIAFGEASYRPFFQYSYELITRVPELQGQEQGVYSNTSYSKGTVRRKLQRLVGGKRFLKIKHVKNSDE